MVLARVLFGTMGKRRFAQVAVSDDEEEEEEKRRRTMTTRRMRQKKEEEEMEDVEELAESEEEEEEVAVEDAKPIGEVIRVSGRGRRKKNHYKVFDYDGNQFELVSSFLLLLIIVVIKTRSFLSLVFGFVFLMMVGFGSGMQDDPVLLSPEEISQKPYVAIIKVTFFPSFHSSFWV